MTTAAPAKRCTKCHKDLTGAKRLKDAKGQYWCPDCGVGDTAGHGSGVGGLMSTCPKCKTSVHATHLIREPKSGTYVCENCAAGVKTKSKGGGSAPAGSDEDAKRKKLIVLAVCLIIGGIVAYYVMNTVIG